MPVTTIIAMALLGVLSAVVAGLAVVKFGWLTVLPIVVLFGLAARWALAPVTLDDNHP